LRVTACADICAPPPIDATLPALQPRALNDELFDRVAEQRAEPALLRLAEAALFWAGDSVLRVR
jgi:hypothetical protein